MVRTAANTEPLALRAGRLLSRAYQDSAFATVAVGAAGEPSGRTLGGWVTDPDDSGIARVLGSSWNGSFAVATESASGVVVAIASNIELDQPSELIERIVALWRAQNCSGSCR